MQTKLFGASASVGEEHFAKGAQRRARTALHDELRIVDELRAALLQHIHQRVFLVRIKRFVEPAELQNIRASRHHVAEDELLLTALPRHADRVVASPTRPECQPTAQHHGEDLLQQRCVGRTKIRTAEHLHLRLFEMNERAAQGIGTGEGIVVEEVDQSAASRTDGCVALDGGLPAASDDDFETVLRVVERARGGDGGNLRLSRSRRDDDGHEWKRVAHGGEVKEGTSKFKVQSSRVAPQCKFHGTSGPGSLKQERCAETKEPARLRLSRQGALPSPRRWRQTTGCH